MRAILVALTFLVGQALAGVFMTSPTNATTGVGGTQMNIVWQEDNKGPTLADVGPVQIGIFVGNQQQQTEVQHITDSVDVSKQTSLSFTIDPKLGPNSNEYFVRMTSLALPSPDQPQFKYQSFSSKFQINGLSGQFSPQAQSQIAGASTAGAIGGGAPTSTGPVAGSVATPVVSSMTTVRVSSTGSPSVSGTSSPSSPSSPTAAPTRANSTDSSAAFMTKGNLGVVGAVVAAVALAL